MSVRVVLLDSVIATWRSVLDCGKCDLGSATHPERVGEAAENPAHTPHVPDALHSCRYFRRELEDERVRRTAYRYRYRYPVVPAPGLDRRAGESRDFESVSRAENKLYSL